MKKRMAAFFAILAAALYALNAPASKLLLQNVPPSMMAALLYLGAGLGIIAMFCGVTNGALASIALSVELFGAEYLPLFGVAVAVSYAMSGQVSLYHTQTFLEPKMGHREPGAPADLPIA